MAFQLPRRREPPPPVRVTLRPASGGTPGDQIVFRLNPEKTSEEHGANYAEVGIAGADWRTGGAGYPQPVEWTRNRPSRKDADLLLYSAPQHEGQSPDIERELAQLEAFLKKDRATGEPPDLIYQEGKRYDVVRLERITVDPLLYTPDLRRTQARVRLAMIVVQRGR